MKALVIGAGPSGLATLKELREAGIDAVCYEAGAGLGGVFRLADDKGGVWPGCRLTSSATTTAYSDFPPEDDSPHQMLHDEYWRYLNQYVDHFGLRDYLRFGARVERVERGPDGKWQIEVRSGDGASTSIEVDAVACCAGLHQTPYTPEELKSFDGELHHSATYKGAEPYSDRRVLIIGAGESGADIIRQVSNVAARCVLSLRRGVAVLPRMRDGVPTDYFSTRLFFALPRWMARSALPRHDVLVRRVATALATAPVLLTLLPVALAVEGWKRIHRRRQALPLPVAKKILELMKMSGGSVGDQFLTKSEAFIYALLEQKCELRGAVQHIDGYEVEFTDGHRESFDTILCCTGYNGAPALFPSVNPGSLYEGIFSPQLGDRVAFIGFVRPAIGAIPPIAEMQARLFALVAQGHVGLPAPEQMHQAIAQDQQAHAKAFGLNAGRLPHLVDYMSYMDRLAALIGCKPTKAILRSDPKLLYKFYCAHFMPAQYRLVGPGATPGAAQQRIKAQYVAYPKLYLPFMAFFLYFSKFAFRLGFKTFKPHLEVT